MPSRLVGLVALPFLGRSPIQLRTQVVELRHDAFGNTLSLYLYITLIFWRSYEASQGSPPGVKVKVMQWGVLLPFADSRCACSPHNTFEHGIVTFAPTNDGYGTVCGVVRRGMTHLGPPHAAG
jgi:hypothetical protein